MSVSEYTCGHCGKSVIPGTVHWCQAIFAGTVPQIGCICPPGANIECQRIDCPRQRVHISAGGITR